MKTRALFHVFATIVILATFVAPAAIQAQHCTDYSYYLRWVTHVDPLVNEYGNGYTAGVAVVGDLAYVAAHSEGLAIYDVVDPENPVLLGAADTPFTCLDVVVDGDYAYVADWWGPGFCVIDVSDPANPAVVGSDGLMTSSYFVDVAVVKPDTVVAVDRYYGVRMFDVSDPANPDMYGGIADSGGPNDLDVQGDYLYVCNNSGDLRIYDVTSVVAPDLISTKSLPGPGYSVDVVGNYAYVACGSAGLQIMNVFDPENPQDEGNLDFPDEDYYSAFGKIHVVGDLAYLLMTDNRGFPGLAVVNVADPSAPYWVNSLGISTQNGPNGLFVSGDHAFVGAWEKGLMIADISMTTSPAFLSSYVEQDFFPQAVAASGDYAYVLDQYFGFRVMDLTSTPAPTLLATVDLIGSALKAVLDGGLAYVADGGGGLQIIDITDPYAPEIIGSLAPFGNQDDVDVQGTFAYLASPTRGLQVVDVSDPTAPVLRGEINPPGTAKGVAVDGDHAYLACQYNGLQVADITNPYAPVVIGELDIEGWPTNVQVARGHAFLCTMEDGLTIVDISNPAAPESVSTLVTPGQVWDVVVDGNLAYIADITGGLQVADISDLSDPRYLGCVDTPSHTAYGVALADGRVCVADFLGGFHVIGQHCVPSAAPEDYVTKPTVSLKAYPNPFNPQTTIAFDLPTQGMVTLRVFDLAGRLVRVIVGGEQYSPGRHEVIWNGRDDTGRPVASGTFFCRLESGSFSETKRVALVK